MNWLAWALLSAFFAGLTAILAKMGLTQVNSHLATAVRTVVVLLFTWILALSVAPVSALSELSRRNWVFLILSGLATGLSWICYFRAMQIGEASRVAPVDKLSVVFTLVLAALFLKEKLGWTQCLGVVLILAGVLLVSWKPARG